MIRTFWLLLFLFAFLRTSFLRMRGARTPPLILEGEGSANSCSSYFAAFCWWILVDWLLSLWYYCCIFFFCLPAAAVQGIIPSEMLTSLIYRWERSLLIDDDDGEIFWSMVRSRSAPSPQSTHLSYLVRVSSHFFHDLCCDYTSHL